MDIPTILQQVFGIGIYTILNGLIIFWFKTRLDNSVKHDYDRILLKLQSLEDRKSVLFEERLDAFKKISTVLLRVKRYCEARHSEIIMQSELAPTTESLTAEENVSLLTHYDNFERLISEYNIFYSEAILEKIGRLRQSLSMGCSLEQHLSEGLSEIELNAGSAYDNISLTCDSLRQSLYDELGFDT